MTTHVLILCTHNSARSVLSEAMLNHWARQLGRDVRAHSAGSSPSGRINPHALQVLEAAGIDTAGTRSKSWDEFAAPGAPEMRIVITVCDSAAGEACPVWIGHPMTAHWGVEDPAAVTGSDVEIQRTFAQAARFLKNRIAAFVSLPLASIDHMALETKLRQIGAMEGSTSPQGKSA